MRTCIAALAVWFALCVPTGALAQHLAVDIPASPCSSQGADDEEGVIAACTRYIESGLGSREERANALVARASAMSIQLREFNYRQHFGDGGVDARTYSTMTQRLSDLAEARRLYGPETPIGLYIWEARLCAYVVYCAKQAWIDQFDLPGQDRAISRYTIEDLPTESQVECARNGLRLLMHGIRQFFPSEFDIKTYSLACIDAALSRAPTNATAHVIRAQLIGTGSVEAERAFLRGIERALTLAPNNDHAHFALGAWHLGHSRLDDASREFRIALVNNPNSLDAENGLCWTGALAEIDLPGSLAHCDRAIALARSSGVTLDEAGDVHDSRGLVLFKLGRYAEAVIEFQRGMAGQCFLGPCRRAEADAGINYYSFPLAVALLRSGQREHGTRVLEYVQLREPQAEERWRALGVRR